MVGKYKIEVYLSEWVEKANAFVHILAQGSVHETVDLEKMECICNDEINHFFEKVVVVKDED